MPFLDILKNLFGAKSKEDHPNYGPEIFRHENDSFRNPIWENEDDDDDGSDFRQPNGGIHFQIFGDPFEMTRYFESQMDHMLKHFFDGFGQNKFMIPFDNAPTIEALPPPEQKPGLSLREQLLKREFDSNSPRVDSDLDGKINAAELSKVLKNPSTTQQQIQPYDPQNSMSRFFSGRATSTQIIRRSDGTLEKRQTFRDSEGNEQTTVTRQIGDKMHEIITKRDKTGAETKTENLINMDENELKTFEDKWKSAIVEKPSMDSNDRRYFPWHKFFGPEPKL